MEFKEAMKKFSKICKGDGKNQNLRCVKECPFAYSNFCQKPPFAYDEKDIVEAEKIISEWTPPVDWSKVKVDTPILVWEDNTRKYKRHFAKYENGKIYVFTSGQTSWSAENYDTTTWKYAELAEEEE